VRTELVVFALGLTACAGGGATPRPAAAPAVATPFTGCVGIHRDASANELACDERLRLVVLDAPVAGSPALLDVLKAAVTREQTEDELTFAEAAPIPDATALAFTTLAQSGWAGLHVHDQGQQRIVICAVEGPDHTAAEATRCRALLVAALAGDPPARIFRAPGLAPPRGVFPGGGPPPVLADCRLYPLTQEISCPAARLTWMWQAQAPRSLPEAIEHVERKFLDAGMTMTSNQVVPCTVDDIHATCHHYVFDWAARSVKLDLIMGLVRSGDDQLAVGCTWASAVSAVVPPPCSALIRLD
jgi:hypothetical protein